jgi:hypothetical protein
LWDERKHWLHPTFESGGKPPHPKIPNEASSMPRLRFVLLTLASLSPASLARAEEPIRGILVAPDRVTPEALAGWKAKGINSLVVPLDEAVSRERWKGLADDAERNGFALYPWIEVARNPAMADAHPDWMAAPGGHHNDWRRRFPNAPVAKPGEVIKAWPWVPIGYAPAFEAHRERVRALLKSLPGTWRGVFLNDLQAGPSSCGCGNDQCRWALDYGSPSTAPKTAGDDPAARLVAEVVAGHRGKAVIPVWVTECEMIDLPRVQGSTGYCGSVECAKNTCWPSYARAWNPLLKATPGPVALAVWDEDFGRGSAWTDTALSLFQKPPRGGDPVGSERVVAVLPAWGGGKGKAESDIAAFANRARGAKGGWVIARSKVEQSWEPRVVKVDK